MRHKKYTNNKNGNQYQVLYEGTDRTNSRDGTRVIIYSPVNDPDEISVREVNEFNEKFTAILTT